MKLNGSCHCGAVHFSVDSAHPYPFNLCYCSICRKTGGGGGYAINLAADHDTLKVRGDENISVYQALIITDDGAEEERSPARRHFCKICGSALWVWDPRWPDLMHPFASVVDSELPISPSRTHLMVASKAPWVELHKGPADKEFAQYPDESIAEWHEHHGVTHRIS